jgi:hypothetical protein
MIVGGIIQATMGVEAARRDLEDIAPPLSATGDALDEPGEEADPYTLAPEEGRKATAGSPRFEREGAPESVPPPAATGGAGEPGAAADRDPVTRIRPTGGQS